jgi:hypothetical protein
VRRRLAIAAALAATLAAPAAGQVVPGWSHEADAGIHFAFYAQRGAELAVRCKGSAVEVVLYMDSALLDPMLQTRTKAIFAVVVDGSERMQWVETRLVIERAVASIGVGGQNADRLARAIGAASDSIATSLLVAPPGPDAVEYNRTVFPVHGAREAIKAAYDGCGIAF